MKRQKIKFLGFTLVELIIVIIILAILATIAFVSFNGYTLKTRDTKRFSDLNKISKGLDIYNIGVGSFPNPANSKTLTGGINSKIISGELTKEVLSSLSSTPIDPVSGKNYVYSITGDGKYYQVAGSFENQVSGVLPKTYADFSYSKVYGNYLFDPSLPSLIISSGSTNIFDSNNCFILNNGTNIIGGTNCVAKKDLSLNSQDSGLIAYYDMESYYQTSYSGVSNVVFLKDLSGNNYDAFFRASTTGLPNSNLSTISGSIFTGTIIGTGIIFDATTFKSSFSTLPVNKGFNYLGRNIINPPGNIFYSSSNNSGGQMRDGISSVSLIDYNYLSAGIKRIVGFGLSNAENVSTGDFLKSIDSSFYRIYGTSLQEHITPHNDGLATSTGVYGLNGCGDNNGTIISPADKCSGEFSAFQNFSYTGKIILSSVIDFSNLKNCVYLNGKEFNCSNLSKEVVLRLQEGGYKYGTFGIGSYTESFNGVIDEVKIYNRKLDVQEIQSQAKILGF